MNEKTMLTEVKKLCACGRSATGYCDGSHALDEEEFQKRLAEAIKVKSND